MWKVVKPACVEPAVPLGTRLNCGVRERALSVYGDDREKSIKGSPRSQSRSPFVLPVAPQSQIISLTLNVDNVNQFSFNVNRAHDNDDTIY
jgi:hypothetical protein